MNDFYYTDEQREKVLKVAGYQKMLIYVLLMMLLKVRKTKVKRNDILKETN